MIYFTKVVVEAYGRELVTLSSTEVIRRSKSAMLGAPYLRTTGPIVLYAKKELSDSTHRIMYSILEHICRRLDCPSLSLSVGSRKTDRFEKCGYRLEICRIGPRYCACDQIEMISGKMEPLKEMVKTVSVLYCIVLFSPFLHPSKTEKKTYRCCRWPCFAHGLCCVVGVNRCFNINKTFLETNYNEALFFSNDKQFYGAFIISRLEIAYAPQWQPQSGK